MNKIPKKKPIQQHLERIIHRDQMEFIPIMQVSVTYKSQWNALSVGKGQKPNSHLSRQRKSI